uniref:Uncharacterized protein n=1 Tax=Lactuca sativa TaxID=4236 RepID=A0A9R1WWA6_LACSA|nr:hypothetical protein LSAT_V11C800453290 [Lactuca sativa]
MTVCPYVDLLHDEKGRSNSNICARLFPDISDACFRLKDLEDYIMSPNYLSLQDEDVVMLILLVFMLKGLHGRNGTYLWTYTSGLMYGMFEKIENFRIFKQTNPEFKKVHKYIVVGFMFPFKITFIATAIQSTTSFYSSSTFCECVLFATDDASSSSLIRSFVGLLLFNCHLSTAFARVSPPSKNGHPYYPKLHRPTMLPPFLLRFVFLPVKLNTTSGAL